MALISTLNSTIAALRATPVRTDILPFTPISIRNYGTSSAIRNVNVGIPRSLLPLPSSIVNVNASNFAVSPIRSTGFVNFNNVISVPSFTNVTIPAAFQNFGITSSGSSAKGTNVINSILGTNFGGGGLPS
jgi:hypothetical protein